MPILCSKRENSNQQLYQPSCYKKKYMFINVLISSGHNLLNRLFRSLPSSLLPVLLQIVRLGLTSAKLKKKLYIYIFILNIFTEGTNDMWKLLIRSKLSLVSQILTTNLFCYSFTALTLETCSLAWAHSSGFPPFPTYLAP